MKRLVNSILAVIGLCFCMLFSGCRAHEKLPLVFLVDLEKGPAFLANVDSIKFMPDVDAYNHPFDGCIVRMHKQDGWKFAISSFGPNPSETTAFAHTLQVGKTYEFPKVWLDYKKSQIRK